VPLTTVVIDRITPTTLTMNDCDVDYMSDSIDKLLIVSLAKILSGRTPA
jgi:hypothetical protein